MFFGQSRHVDQSFGALEIGCLEYAYGNFLVMYIIYYLLKR
jgi:hypothetical protein